MKKLTQKQKDKLKDALNRLDELASYATEKNDNKETEQQAKDYNRLFELIDSL